MIKNSKIRTIFKYFVYKCDLVYSLIVNAERTCMRSFTLHLAFPSPPYSILHFNINVEKKLLLNHFFGSTDDTIIQHPPNWPHKASLTVETAVPFFLAHKDPRVQCCMPRVPVHNAQLCNYLLSGLNGIVILDRMTKKSRVHWYMDSHRGCQN